ncbi:hypothetical protein SO802_023789 [Lithocarpus litseifolius]|uniref:Uncharacterized protein n=1 Tax=Lithocarpus litseifolius TaxID=425828 RepID=A0AAW2C771_9ROSI
MPGAALNPTQLRCLELRLIKRSSRYCSENKKRLIHFSTCEVYGKTIGSFLPKDSPLRKVEKGRKRIVNGQSRSQSYCSSVRHDLMNKLNKRSIGGKDISYLILSRKYIAIAVVDQHKYMHYSAVGLGLRISVFQASLAATPATLVTSYVVICGYDTNADEFEIIDPASSRFLKLHCNIAAYNDSPQQKK